MLAFIMTCQHQTNFKLPIIGQLKKQFAHLDKNYGRSGPVITDQNACSKWRRKCHFYWCRKKGTKIYVAAAMRTQYATVLMTTLLIEAVTIMLAKKQSFVAITDDNNHLMGLISLTDVREFSTYSIARNRRPEELIVTEMCSDGSKCNIPWTIMPNMDIFTAQMLMVNLNLSRLRGFLDNSSQSSLHPVGVLDMECLRLAYMVFATTKLLGKNDGLEELKD